MTIIRSFEIILEKSLQLEKEEMKKTLNAKREVMVKMEKKITRRTRTIRMRSTKKRMKKEIMSKK